MSIHNDSNYTNIPIFKEGNCSDRLGGTKSGSSRFDALVLAAEFARNSFGIPAPRSFCLNPSISAVEVSQNSQTAPSADLSSFDLSGKSQPAKYVSSDDIINIRSQKPSAGELQQIEISRESSHFGNGDRYQGSLINGTPHGLGSLFLANGDRYEGSFERGKMHGKGIYIFRNGDRYEGDFIDGKQEGWGKTFSHKGHIYEGPMIHGQATGMGTCYYANGSVYKGRFLNYTHNGLGTLFSVDGCIYEGLFVKGHINGFGICRFPNGDRYEGNFVDGVMHGKGTFISKKGDRYQGDFTNGEITGQGVRTYPNGARYEGSFFKGREHGEGKQFCPNGNIFKGSYVNGSANGIGTFYYLNRPELTLTREWFEDRMLSKNFIDDLSHPAFLSCLLDKTLFPCPKGMLHILSNYFNSKKEYSNIGNALQSAIAPAPANQIFADLTASEHSKPHLIHLDISSHSMLLEIKTIENNVIFTVFNSGEGLNHWHDHDLSKGSYYQTALQIQVPKKSMNQQMIARFLNPFESVNDVYACIYDLPGAKKLENIKPILQKDQKGQNCNMECIFAYLKNKCGEKLYHRIRMEFFEDCIQAIKTSGNQASHPFLQKLEEKKTRRSKKYLDIF